VTRAYALPSDTGTGAFEVFHLSEGWCLMRSFHQFAPDTSGQWFPLGEFEIDLGRPALVLYVCRSSSAALADAETGRSWQFGQGLSAVVRRTTGRFGLQVQGGCDSVLMALVVAEDLLAVPLGAEVFGRFVEQLGLGIAPSFSVRLLSQGVENALFDSLSKTLPGLAHSFFLQAKVTETVAVLMQYLSNEPAAESYASIRVREIHSRLLSGRQRTPLLADLAEETGVPAKDLSDEFHKLYGRSLAAFLYERRMEEARAALVETSVPLTELALRFGFAEAATFGQAFRKHFGVTPESLR